MHNIKILILEDHSLTRHLLALALRSMGFNHLHCAESGGQAFELLRVEHHFDVLICDIQMDGVDGLSFLRESHQVGTIAALITFTAIREDLRLAIQQLARLTGYQVLGDLVKPFSKGQLLQLLHRYRPAVSPSTPPLSIPDFSENEITRGLENNEFIPYFQPKIELKTLSVVGAETLVRWDHPQYGVLAPGFFLEQVKFMGALDALTYSITQKSLHLLHQLPKCRPFYLSINLDITQLALPGLSEIIGRLLDDNRVSAQQLIIEITETGLLQAPIISIENLVRLRLLGCGVSIDDFGAGFSSMQRVCEMPCTELKLDASFTKNIVHNPRIMAAVDSVLHFSKQLGIAVVAEGIETLEQLSALQNSGCSIGQGYYFSRPLAAVPFIEWVQQQPQHFFRKG